MSKTHHQAPNRSSQVCGTVQAPYRPKGYCPPRATPTVKTKAKLYNKASTLT